MVEKDWGPILRYAYEHGCNHAGPVSVFGRQTNHEASRGSICVGGQATVVIWRTIAIVPAKREGTSATARRRREGHRLTGRWRNMARSEDDSRCHGAHDRYGGR